MPALLPAFILKWINKRSLLSWRIPILLPLLLLGLELVSLFALLEKGKARAAINEEIYYQGKLTDQNYAAIADGEYQMTFKLYTVASGGTATYDELWTDANTCNTTINGAPTGGTTTTVPYNETAGNCSGHGAETSFAVGQIVCNTTDKTCTEITAVDTTANTITVAGDVTASPFSWAATETISNQPAAVNGVFAVRIGSLNPTGDPLSAVNFNQDLWLGVTVEADSEMVPRRKIASVPSAETADKLDNIDSASFLRSDTSDSYTSGTLSFSDATFLDLASILHDDSANQGLRLPQNTTLTSPTSGEGYLAWDSAANQLKVYNGSSWTAVVSGSSDCSGTACVSAYEAEYPSAIIQADGTNNVGTMTSGVENHETNFYFNYYEWTSSQTTLQDQDIYFLWRVPQNWASWTAGTDTTITVDMASENTTNTNNKVDVTIYKQGSAGSEADTANVSAVAGDWQTAIAGDSAAAVIGFDESTSCANCLGDLSFSAGSVLVMKITLYSKDNYYVRVGQIKINWTSN